MTDPDFMERFGTTSQKLVELLGPDNVRQNLIDSCAGGVSPNLVAQLLREIHQAVPPIGRLAAAAELTTLALTGQQHDPRLSAFAREVSSDKLPGTATLTATLAGLDWHQMLPIVGLLSRVSVSSDAVKTPGVRSDLATRIVKFANQPNAFPVGPGTATDFVPRQKEIASAIAECIKFGRPGITKIPTNY